jgi:gamma-glutamyltranspeptidase/glutathione hydrolase
VAAEFPYPSIRRPVFGEAMVVASQPLAAQAGVAMLQAGGNAVDAAIAAAATIAVVEPTNNGVGGDAFAQVWDSARLHGLNASGRAPAAIDAAPWVAAGRMPERGWGSVTVPGAVSAWVALWKQFGRLPLAQLLRPAVGYARDGFHVSPGVARKWADQADLLREQPGFANNFLPDGRAPHAGARFRQPALAATLERIVRTEGEDFYRGVTAHAMAEFAQRHDAALALDDLDRHVAEWSGPLVATYRDTEVFEMPPNGQGIVALFALSILDHFDLRSLPVDSAASIHVQVEAMKLAFAELSQRIGDPALGQTDPMQWLDAARVAAAVARIDPAKAQDFGHRVAPLAGTVYLAAGDREGRMVSFIQSNYMGFGSGVVVPGTGVALQNRGAGFSVKAGSAAAIAPRRRPFHTILPGFLRRSDGALAAFGSTGGEFQPQGHVQLVVRLAAYGQNPQAIVDAPRFKIGPGRRLTLEPGFPPATRDGLRALGHDLIEPNESTWDFGGMQILLRCEDRYIGAADSRRDSHVAAI